MAADKNTTAQQTPQNTTSQKDSDTNEGEGRLQDNGSANKPADISGVDQQEGEMNNGTVGGNMDAGGNNG